MNAENKIWSWIPKHYNKGAVKALDGVSLSVKQGEVVADHCPSGSGKSTFLRSLNLLEEPTDGHIYMDGADLMDRKVNINKHRQKMGTDFPAFQSVSPYDHPEESDLRSEKAVEKLKKRQKKKAMELLAARLSDRQTPILPNSPAEAESGHCAGSVHGPGGHAL